MQKPSVEPDDLAACRHLLCGGSRSFFAASLLLPRQVRAPATALYAFCRLADDAIDLGTDKPAALGFLHAQLDAAYCGGRGATPFARAFAATVRGHHIPRALPEALIEGLAWDVEGRRYQNLDDLLDYAARVAGTVGVMMGLIMGVRDADALARAADLGVAMQLTNIARDVGEDAHAGRLFLPLNWLADAGIDPELFLAAPAFSTQLGDVVAQLLAEADRLYRRAETGIAKLPLSCRPGIAAARHIYAAIGSRLAESNHNSIDDRAHVPGRQKLHLAFRGFGNLLRSANAAGFPVLPANAFLLRDIQPVAVPATGLANLLQIFERLERAQRESSITA
jgi:phytoene synthase